MATSRPKIPVLISYPEFQSCFANVASKFPYLELRFCGWEPEALNQALRPDTEILICEELPDPNSHVESLRWIHLFASGYEYLLGCTLPKPDLILTNSSGAYSDGMAEFTLMRMLMHSRKAEEIVAAQWRKEWTRNHLGGTTLRGKRLVVIGGGSVGREVARLAREFGMDVSVAGRADQNSLPDLVEEANFVVITASLNPSSKGLLNGNLLARMKRHPYLVNVARGAIVNTAALVDAVRGGVLAGAALDVFETEPLPPDSPLYTTPGISVSPHICGTFEEARIHLVDLFERNLECYLNQEPLPNRIYVEAPHGRCDGD